MGFLDKLLGRSKQAAGDMKGDQSMQAEGMHQDRKAAAEDRADAAEASAQDERAQAAAHEAQQEAES